MRPRGFSTALLLASVAGIVMMATGALDVRVSLRENAANAIDLFNSDEDSKDGKSEQCPHGGCSSLLAPTIIGPIRPKTIVSSVPIPT